MTLGDLVKKYRTDNNISMEEFSKKCNLSKGYISMLENNINPRNNKPIAPTLPTIRKIALGMNTDIDTILKILDKNQEISLETDFLESTNIPKGSKKREKQKISEIEPIQTIITKKIPAINLEYTQSTTTPEISMPEYRIIEKYRQLDQHGQKIVDFILDEEHERSVETQKNTLDIDDSDDIPPTAQEMELKSVKQSIHSDVE